MISWVNTKIINQNSINHLINRCIVSKHLTNNGKNVINLQNKIKNIFKINDDKSVLMVCNGAMGLNALIGGLNIFYNKKLKFVVQSFTFPCSSQGLLYDSIVIDIDDNMGPSLDYLTKNLNSYDGIVITNSFGCTTNIHVYEQFCKNNNLILLFDNAAAPYTIYDNSNHLNYGNGCMVSLHHTKPIGFGEGGFIIFDNIYLDAMRRAICFGYTDTDKYSYDPYASNYKMSEINAIYIDDYLNNLDDIFQHHTNMIKYFLEKMEENKLNDHLQLYKNYSNYTETLLSTIPCVFKKKIELNHFIEKKIEAKKYYYPLCPEHEISKNIFDRIICLPLNLDVHPNHIDHYIDIIKNII